jgi:hypothetical protein
LRCHKQQRDAEEAIAHLTGQRTNQTSLQEAGTGAVVVEAFDCQAFG